ncbi:hypothetical protein AnigIFM49718_000801, partial [Aspergillus niger]
MGVYIGSQYTKTGAAQLLSSFQDHQNLLDKYVASQLALEDCGDKSIGPEIIGVFIDATGNISAVPTAYGDGMEPNARPDPPDKNFGPT